MRQNTKEGIRNRNLGTQNLENGSRKCWEGVGYQYGEGKPIGVCD